MRINVEQELISVATKRKEKAKDNEVITEVNRLLEYDGLRDVEIMSKIAPKSVTERAKDEKGKVIELEKEEDYYGGTVFEEQQIVSLAKKYRLKFLPASYYKSYMDMTIPQEIKKLEKQISKSRTEERAKRENKTVAEYIAEFGEIKFEFDASELGRKFFVLAPPECFQLKEEGMVNKTVPDPILFYKTTADKYRLVKKWGSDFTIARRMSGFLWANENRFRFFTMGLPVLILSAVLALLFNSWWHYAWFVIPCAAGIIVFLAVMAHEFKAGVFLDEGWCTSEKTFGFYKDK